MRSGTWVIFAAALACNFDAGGIGGAGGVPGGTSTTTTTAEPEDGSTTRAGTTAAGSTTAAADDTTSAAASTTASTTAAADDTTSTTTATDGASSGPGEAIERCDGIDNDSDGAIDEPSPANLVCADCTSLIVEDVAFTTCTAEASWEDARARCMVLGGDLASFTDSSEQEAVVASASGDRWIGLTDAAREDAWTWADAGALTFDDWRAQEPDDWPPGEDCGQIRGTDGGWGDAGCESLRDYICEVPLD
jgi:hypothetical protein